METRSEIVGERERVVADIYEDIIATVACHRRKLRCLEDRADLAGFSLSGQGRVHEVLDNILVALFPSLHALMTKAAHRRPAAPRPPKLPPRQWVKVRRAPPR